ncbi:MAG TPA: bifunctional enoyl-CoA hydratase/phosphate acetyltransferase [Bacteroidales bacterium]|jgi:phosphate butyryltransferase|nr:bifunctional enoyl-CoA hydratase/phosphate acetyltransferase [Bacteroidales bacterium]MDD4236479.1 bifunctional enoyl-CoA hydratase/phosphate acetyltransferase [Bacteroidales bacterium]HRW21743.1 bifunctional enoyl-CoA hydratase/phosphate acetyltransferase [Bacteroidales bacterium]
MVLKKIDELIEIAKSKETRVLAVAASADKHVVEAVANAAKDNIVIPIFVGNEKLTKEYAEVAGLKIENIRFINEINDAKACAIAVNLVREGKADILMKGQVATATLLKAVLDKENGLRTGSTLSHFALFESPYYHKLIGVTDAAMNVAPEFQDKVSIVKNAVSAMQGIGIEMPKLAVIGPVEVVNPKIESTVHAAMLTQMNKRGQISNCIIDGPLAIDNAVSKEACQQKKIVTEVGGDADILMAPELNAANILYKMFSFMGGAVSAAVILGAKCPIVLTSRADSEHTKLLSIAFAAAM